MQQDVALPQAPPGWSYVLMPRPMIWILEEFDDKGNVIATKSYPTQRSIAKEYGVTKDFVCQLYKGNMKHGWKKHKAWKNRRIVRFV